MTEPSRVTKETLVDSLRAALPDFEIKSEWADDGLDYPIFNDLARYICDRAELKDFDEIRKCLAFLELSLRGEDSYVHDLVLECLETLFSCSGIDSIKQHFGPRVAGLWQIFFEKQDDTSSRARKR